MYSTYFYKLGNIDAYFSLQPEILSEMKADNAIEELIKFYNFSKNNSILETKMNERIKKTIDFVACHFEEIDKEEKKKLSIDLLSLIIESKSLKINDEDSLLDFVLEMYEKDRECSILFEYILFSNLSEDKLKLFIEQFNIEDLNIKIWNSFCKRVFKKDENENKNDNDRYTDVGKGILEFKNEEGKELEGIMRYLTKTTGGNIHDNKTIEITSNMIYELNHPKNLVDYQNDNYYYPSGNEKNAYVCFDFKDKLVQITGYSIKSYDGKENSRHIRNWSVEVSNDGERWEEIDRRQNESSLNGPNRIVSFQISPERKQFYRFIRILETGLSWDGRNNRYDGVFSKVEFFGKLQQPQKK